MKNTSRLSIITLFLILSISFSQSVHAQVFQKLSAGMKDYKPDFSTPPDDKLTAFIKEYRSLRGGFNINEVVEFKLAEDSAKHEITEGSMQQLKYYFTQGEGKEKLNNAAIWIYRNKFSLSEMKKITRFARTDAGKKMAENFPLIMMQSLAAGELLKKSVPGK